MGWPYWGQPLWKMDEWMFFIFGVRAWQRQSTTASTEETFWNQVMCCGQMFPWLCMAPYPEHAASSGEFCWKCETKFCFCWHPSRPASWSRVSSLVGLEVEVEGKVSGVVSSETRDRWKGREHLAFLLMWIVFLEWVRLKWGAQTNLSHSILKSDPIYDTG